MAIYYGVVRDNHVEFEGEVPLADGTRVEIRLCPLADDEQAQAESGVKERLRAVGILAPAEALASGDDLDQEFEPVAVTGRPLSEQIIDERR
jgi:hypothetical protein